MKLLEWERLQQMPEEAAMAALARAGEPPEEYVTHYSCLAVVPKRNWSVEFICLLVVTKGMLFIFEAEGVSVRNPDPIFRIPIAEGTTIRVGLSMQIIRITRESLSLILVTGQSTVTATVLSHLGACEISTWELEETKHLSDMLQLDLNDLRAYSMVTLHMEGRVLAAAAVVCGELLTLNEVDLKGFGLSTWNFYKSSLLARPLDEVQIVEERESGALVITWHERGKGEQSVSCWGDFSQVLGVVHHCT